MPVDMVSVSALSRATTQNNEQGSSRLNVGSTYFAEVLDRIDHALAAVRIGGITYSMELGKNFAAGQTINLRCIALDPNPTFLLNAAAASSGSAEQVTLSTAGAMVSRMVEDTGSAEAASRKTGVQGALTSTITHTESVAAELRNGIGRSGLFYEAHLVDCATGQADFGSVLAEPQNQPGFDPASLVAKQLDVLEKQAVQWQGLVWPGQQMVLTIGVEDPEERTGEDDAQSPGGSDSAAVNSVLRLDMPKLGPVVARLTMQGDGLNVRIEAEHPGSERIMQQALGDLALSLKDRGPVLESLLVTSRESK